MHSSSRKRVRMDAEHYKINRLFMSWIGQWPEQARYKRYFLSAHLIFAVFGQICLLTCGLVAAWKDWDLVIECASPITIHTLCLVKFFNCLFNTHKMRSLTHQMRNTWSLMTFDSQMEILKSYTAKGKKMTVMYAAFMYSCMCMYLFLPITPPIMAFLTNANRTFEYVLLYHVESIFNVEKYYYLILLHSYYSTFFLMTIPIAADSQMIIYVQHACGLFKAIGHQLENIKQNDELNINIYPLHKNDEYYRLISNSIVKHKEVLRFTKSLTSAYNISLFVLTILNTMVMTFSGMQAVINLNRPLEAFRFSMTGICLTMHFLFLSIPGQELIDHSTKIYHSVYSVQWYGISMRARKLLNIMLMRNKIPCQMTAGKIYVMSLQNFSSVVQASMSYFTILSSLR